MAIEFGNINKMTRDNFETAINYYEEKLTKMQSDESIDENTKKYFVDLYTARIKELKKLLRDLDNEIVAAKSVGYVNDKTATFESLGKTKSDSGTMSTISQDQEKYERAQFWRFVGAVLLPIVGTIPFIKKMIKAKKEFKAIENAKVQENIDLGKLVQSERRPYEKNLGKKGNFSEAEKQILLSNQAEISRLEAALEDDTLNPAERKNLVAKLADLRKYAQENGYEIEDGVLADEAYETDKDKDERKIGELAGAVSEVSEDVENLVDAQEKVHRLEAQKKDAEKLLEKYPDNATLQEVVDSADVKIETIKDGAQLILDEASTEKINALNAVALVTGDDESKYEDYNNDIQEIYESDAEYGMTLANAKAIAEDIGLDALSIVQVSNEYSRLKTDNDGKLNNVRREKEKASTIENLLVESENLLKLFEPGERFDIATLGDDLAEEVVNARQALNKVNANLERLETEFGIVPSGDGDGLRLRNAKQRYAVLNNDVRAKETTSEVFAFKLENARAKIDELKAGVDEMALDEARTRHDEIKNLLDSAGLSDYCDSVGKTTEYLTLQSELQDLENNKIKIREQRVENDKSSLNLDEYEDDIDAYIDFDDIEDVKNYKNTVEPIFNALSSESFQSVLNKDTLPYVQTLCEKARIKLDQCNEVIRIKEEEEARNKAEEKAKRATITSRLRDYKNRYYDDLEAQFGTICDATDNPRVYEVNKFIDKSKRLKHFLDALYRLADKGGFEDLKTIIEGYQNAVDEWLNNERLKGILEMS